MTAKSFLTYLTQKGLRSSTIGLTLIALRGLYDEIKALGMLRGENPWNNPAVRLPRGSSKPSKPTEAMSEEDAALLLSLPDRSTPRGKRDYALMSLLFGVGLRRSEVLHLRCEDIIQDYTYTKLRLYDTKTASMEEVSIAPWVVEALNDWLDVAEDTAGSVFDMSPTGLWKIFKGYCKKANLKGRFSPHSARCTAINILSNKGVGIAAIQIFSRHASVGSVDRYLRKWQHLEMNPGLQLTFKK